MTNTKARHIEILAAATEAIKTAGGVAQIDALDKVDRISILRQLALSVAAETGCVRDTARRNVAKALRKSRFTLMKERDPDTWGGARPNAGRPKAEETRQKVSTRLAPGAKELAMAIAEIEGLNGWGRVVDLALVRLVEGDPALKIKLAQMGIIVKKWVG